ncbi:hypothetical protein M501DRAFT_977330 [Patellaria atrata CBS 101060]|uniref:Polyketide synthase n=1 Tax=Patellaria atrata CBS 101060 TaxID=1346257 RepID=A0A9P4S8C3_9PEZI|nr:hypothetical protein M501DRAFT_977330 [Patellaria atrata CBS 101060]
MIAGCRLPGDASSPSKLWTLLENEKSSQSDVPKNRFNVSSWYHPDSHRPGSIHTHGGYFLGDDDSYRGFDPSFFGISPLEATSMDPQQRKLLETVYESFESAGARPEDLSGSNTACYIGNFTWDIGQMQARDVEYGAAYHMTGGGITILSNRISYVFNLKGPSFTIDTACSSTMYALHLACKSLQAGDCEAAIVGGTNLIFGVEQQIGSVRLGVLSPTSICHTFDESADGYARGEAVGALYIKRLSAAIANNDPIRAVIRGTAINANGRSLGISHPSKDDQESCIRQAYANANLSIERTAYFECHGTGTPVGDPLEVEAIGRVFSKERTAQEPLLLGSVKTNLGHGEAASAIPAIIKTVLCLEKGLIPATIGIKKLNPALNLCNGSLKVVQALSPWPEWATYRRASINSFGYGGANAHAVLDAVESYFASHSSLRIQPLVTGLSLSIYDSATFENTDCNGSLNGYKNLSELSNESSQNFHVINKVISNRSSNTNLKEENLVDQVKQEDELKDGSTDGILDGIIYKSDYESGNSEKRLSPSTLDPQKRKHLLLFSSHNEATLRKNIEAVSEVLYEYSLSNLAYTLSSRRGRFSNRAFAVISEEEVSANSSQHFQSRFKAGSIKGTDPILAFIFTGQGAHWPQMGLSLAKQYPSVLETFQYLDGILASTPHPPSWTIMEVLQAPKSISRINNSELSQPLCTAVQIAIVDLLRVWGIMPKAVVGHSSGEIAAAYTTGYLSASTAIIIAYQRGISASRRNVPGAMLAVGLGADHVNPFIENIDDIAIACHNSPQSVTLSGTDEAIDKARGMLSRAGVFNRKLATSGNAYHSPLMKDAGEDYDKLLQQSLSLEEYTIPLENSEVRMYSSVTGSLITVSRIEHSYWRQNLESPVLFDQAAQELLKSHPDINHIIEIGPHPALSSSMKDIKESLGFATERLVYHSTLKRDGDGAENMLNLVGSLFVSGYDLNIASITSGEVEDNSIAPGICNSRVVVDLPSYQWVYEDILWHESRLSTELRFRQCPRHDLLGSRILGTSRNSPTWRNILHLDDVPWLRDHKVGDDIVFPAAGYIAMAVEAARQTVHPQPVTYRIETMKISSAIILHDDSQTEILFDLKSFSGSDFNFTFNVSSVTSGKWTEHATGHISVSHVASRGPPSDMSAYKGTRSGINQDANDRLWYEAMSRVGLSYGPAFTTLQDVRSNPETLDASARISFRATQGLMMQESNYVIHPTAIDGCLQLAVVAAHQGNPDTIKKPYLPVHIEKFLISPSVTTLDCENVTAIGHGERRGLRSIHTSTRMINNNGDVFLEAAINFFSLETNLGTAMSDTTPQPYSRLVWKPDFDHLSNSNAISLFRSEGADESRYYFSKLEEVAALAILNSSQILPDDLHVENLPGYMQNFVAWLKDKAKDLSTSGTGFLSTHERDHRISRIVQEIGSQVPEAAMVAKLNSRMKEIVTGETGALDVMVEEDLITRIYGEGFGQVGAYAKLQKTMELISHKEPRLNILELGAGTGGATRPMLKGLGAHDVLAKYEKYVFTDVSTAFLSGAAEAFKDRPRFDFRLLDIEKDPVDQGFELESFDIVFASNVIHATRNITKTLENCNKLLKPGGRLLIIETTKNRLVTGYLLGTLPGYWLGADDGRPESPFISKAAWDARLIEAGFTGTDIVLNDYPEPNDCTTLMISRRRAESGAATSAIELVESKEERNKYKQPVVWLVYKESPHRLLTILETLYEERSIQTQRVALLEFSKLSSKGARTIMLVELETALLARMNEYEMKATQEYMELASTSVWVTNGGVLQGEDPEKALIFGIAKSVMVEQPSFHVSSFDLEHAIPDLERSAKLIIEHEIRFFENPDSDLDTELVEKDGIVYISRYHTDDLENLQFERSSYINPEILPLQPSLHLDFKKVGQIDSFYFKESEKSPLGANEVLVESTAFAFDKSLSGTMKGQKSHPFFSLEAAGVVKSISPSVTKLGINDYIVCLRPNKLDTSFTIHEDLCVPLRYSEDPRGMVDKIYPTVAAVYILRKFLGVHSGDKVMIDCSGDVLNIALAQVAVNLGVEVLVTCASEDENKALIGIKSAEVIDRSKIQLTGILDKSTFDIIITNPSSVLQQNLPSMVRRGGQVIILSEMLPAEFASLPASLFSRAVNINCVNILDVLSAESSRLEEYLVEAVGLIRRHTISIPSKSFDLSELKDAIIVAENPDYHGRVVVSSNPTTMVPIYTPPAPIEFNPEASYLLIGCLGGLGRSLTAWMVSHGARNLIYLSRTGSSKPVASALISELDELRTLKYPTLNITVIRGSVTSCEDIACAIAAAPTPIKGVIQASMVVKDSIFTHMSHEAYTSVISPKLFGTLNLHEQLKDQDLDFFVMASSVIGAIGTATQANYCAANAFLDHMARHRHALGLQATSIALGMILGAGHVEEHPEVEKALLRNGMYGIGVSEYLRYMDLACRRRNLGAVDARWAYDKATASHVVTGVDATRISRAGGKSLWLRDNRLRNLVLHMDLTSASSLNPSIASNTNPSAAAATSSSAQSTQQLLTDVYHADPASLNQAILTLLLARFSKLVLLPADKVDPEKSLVSYGLDSMIGAELRSWGWREFGVDVPFLGLLEGGMTFVGLSALIVEGWVSTKIGKN